MTQVSPCDWPVTLCETCCTETLTEVGETVADLLKAMAATFLWKATGQRYGLCEVTYRPCASQCAGTYALPEPYRIDGQWLNLTCDRCVGSCGCGGVISEIYLPGTYAVTGIVVDGVALDPLTDVIVYDNSRVVRADGEVWPTCQDLASPSDPVSGVAGTWQITTLQGLPIPPGGDVVAGILACELAKACTNDSNCRLPRNVQNVTRNGVTVGFQDVFGGLADMKTGLWEVDTWIESNRAVRWRDPVIGSLDVPIPPVRTWPLP